MYQIFSLMNVPQRDKFDCFSGLVDKIFCPMHNEPNPVSIEPFDASIELAELGRVKLANVTTSPVIIRRRKQDISRMCNAPYLVKFQMQGEAFWSQCNRDVHLRPGDFVICSTSEPYKLQFNGPSQMSVLAIDEHVMRQLTPDPNQFLGREMPGYDVACGLLSSLVAQVVHRMSSLPEPMVERVVTNILDLLGGVLSVHSAANTQAQLPRQKLIDNIKGVIKRNLRNRGLGPSMIADEFGVSTRYVHKLFEAESLTVNRYIQSLRLDGCFHSLTDAKFANYSITDIAHYWGFYDLPHMTRCFRKTYSVTPKCVRNRGGPVALAS